jgi:fatty acid desaturase
MTFSATSKKNLTAKKMRYDESPIPPEVRKSVNAVLSRHVRISPALSYAYLARDLCATGAVYALYTAAEGSLPELLLYPLYSISMGTVAFGLWVLGHECGHGAFGRTRLENDAVGFVLHSLLLVPYFSWQYSHNKHHKYTNHLIRGETHVPPSSNGASGHLKAKRLLSRIFGGDTGDDVFAFFSLVAMLLGGWPAYMFFNISGGRVTAGGNTMPDEGARDHFRPWSQVFPSRIGGKVAASTLGCMATLKMLFATSALYVYAGPYIVVNCWLVMYTYLQHTHPDVPHYGETGATGATGATDVEFSHMIGALCTIDRPYPWLCDHLHHHIGSTHVAHHLNYKIPHYEAVECTRRLKKVLGDRYLYDPTPIWRAALFTVSRCMHMESTQGRQYWRDA